MSTQASIPVETINESKSLTEQESSIDEDSDSDDDSIGPPPLVIRYPEVDSSDDEC